MLKSVAIKGLEANSQAEQAKGRYAARCVSSRQASSRTVLTAFTKLPDRNFRERIDSMNRFEAGLFMFYFKMLKKTWGPLKEQHEAGVQAMRHAIVNLINRSTGALKNRFNEWHREAALRKIRDKIQMTEALFRVMLEVEASSTLQIFDGRNAMIMEKCLNKLFANLSQGLTGSFKRWHHTAKQLTINCKMQDEKKIIMVRMFETAL